MTHRESALMDEIAHIAASDPRRADRLIDTLEDSGAFDPREVKGWRSYVNAVVEAHRRRDGTPVRAHVRRVERAGDTPAEDSMLLVPFEGRG